jgi:hypothetical protein
MTDKLPNPEVRQTAMALFRRWYGDESRWLVVRDAHSGDYRLIEAERLEEESFRESLDRELAWRLHLRRGKDYLISSVPRLHFPVTVTETSGCSGEEEQRREVIEFYLVELYGSGAVNSLESQADVQWWPASRMLAEPACGEPVFDPRQRRILIAADVLCGEP